MVAVCMLHASSCLTNFDNIYFFNQDELEDIAAAHEEGLIEIESDDEELTEEERKAREEARIREDMEDMGFA